MVSTDKVPFCLSGCSALNIRRVDHATAEGRGRLLILAREIIGADGRANVIKGCPRFTLGVEHVSHDTAMGHAVGKSTMFKAAKEEAPRLIASLKEVIGSHRRVFVCCHKSVEPQLVIWDTGFDDFAV